MMLKVEMVVLLGICLNGPIYRNHQESVEVTFLKLDSPDDLTPGRVLNLLRRPPVWFLLLVLLAGSVSLTYAAVTTGAITNYFNPQPPTQPREVLSFETLTINSGTNVTLYIRNMGTVSVSFTSYSVVDPYTGDKYYLNNWSGASISPTATVPVNILIGSSCPGCGLTGKPFNFSTYDHVTIVTARGTQFMTQA
jgi:hypothetical protein